jgi:hypothetical protein
VTCLRINNRVRSVLIQVRVNSISCESVISIGDKMSCMRGVKRGIEWLRCNTVMWHDVIWGEMTCHSDTYHDSDLTWMTGNGHGSRIRGDNRWNLSRRFLLHRLYQKLYLNREARSGFDIKLIAFNRRRDPMNTYIKDVLWTRTSNI